MDKQFYIVTSEGFLQNILNNVDYVTSQHAKEIATFTRNKEMAISTNQPERYMKKLTALGYKKVWTQPAG